MLDEPIYEYRKGQGWVPSLRETVTARCRQGKLYRLEMRLPEDGEFFCWNFKDHHWTLKTWVSWLRDINFTLIPDGTDV
jgi:hypothetical protein